MSKTNIKNTGKYPLEWPSELDRNPTPEKSRFRDPTMRAAVKAIVEEVTRLGGTNPTISTNLPLNKLGSPYSGMRQPTDKGVVVYFTIEGERYFFAADKYNRVECNAWGISKTIEALRGVARYGVTDMLEGAMQGFKMISQPSTDADEWFPASMTSAIQIKKHWRDLVLTYHPDHGGDSKVFQEIQKAYKAAMDRTL